MHRHNEHVFLTGYVTSSRFDFSPIKAGEMMVLGQENGRKVGKALEAGKSLVRMTEPRSEGRFLFRSLTVYLLNTLKRAI